MTQETTKLDLVTFTCCSNKKCYPKHKYTYHKDNHIVDFKIAQYRFIVKLKTKTTIVEFSSDIKPEQYQTYLVPEILDINLNNFEYQIGRIITLQLFS